MVDNSPDVDQNADAAQRVQEKFDFYVVALTFTVLGLSVQTAPATAAKAVTSAELLGWLALLVSGIVGLWRLEWMAPALFAASERESRASLATELRRTIASGTRVVVTPDRAPLSREDLLGFLKDHEAAVTLYDKKVDALEKVGLAKYRVQKVALLFGLLSLMVARALPHLARLFAVLGVALAVSCGGEPGSRERKAPVVSPSHSPSRPEGDWERSRQCAEQADRAAKRNGWVEGQTTGRLKVMGWTNHYSPTFGRCFVRVDYLNEDAKSDKTLPLLVYSLFDPFENRELANCTDSTIRGVSSFCSVFESDPADAKDDCAGCRQFVKERMK